MAQTPSRRRVVWGAERTVLLFINEERLEAPRRGLGQQLAKRIQDLEAWREQLAKPRSGPKDVAKFQGGQYLKDFLQPTKGRPRCTWQLEETDPEAFDLYAKLVPPSASVCYTPGQA